MFIHNFPPEHFRVYSILASKPALTWPSGTRLLAPVRLTSLTSEVKEQRKAWLELEVPWERPPMAISISWPRAHFQQPEADLLVYSDLLQAIFSHDDCKCPDLPDSVLYDLHLQLYSNR